MKVKRRFKSMGPGQCHLGATSWQDVGGVGYSRPFRGLREVPKLQGAWETWGKGKSICWGRALLLPAPTPTPPHLPHLPPPSTAMRSYDHGSTQA